MSLLLDMARRFSLSLFQERQSAPPTHDILMTGFGNSEFQMNRFESWEVLAIRFVFKGDHFASLD
jgi:hypothetical protein